MVTLCLFEEGSIFIHRWHKVDCYSFFLSCWLAYLFPSSYNLLFSKVNEIEQFQIRLGPRCLDLKWPIFSQTGKIGTGKNTKPNQKS